MGGLSGLSGLTGLSGTAGGRRIYLLRDLFTTTDAAPITDPRTCEPGPGALTFTDSTNKYAVLGKRLAIAGGNNGSTDPAFNSGAIARVAGRAVVFSAQALSGACTYGISASAGNAGPTEIGIVTQGATLRGEVYTAGPTWRGQAGLMAHLNGSAHEIAFVVRPTGYFAVVRENGVWYLLWPHKTWSTDPIYVAACNYDGIGKLKHLRVLDLPKWTNEANVYTNKAATPPADTNYTATADGFLEFTITWNTSDIRSFYYRYQDATHYWLFKVNNDSNLILYYRNGAGETLFQHAGGAKMTNGTTHRILVRYQGNVHQVYIDDVITAAAGTDAGNLFLTVTTVRTGADMTRVSDLITWPRDVTSAMPASMTAKVPQLAFDGDSLTFGGALIYAYPDQLLDGLYGADSWSSCQYRNVAIAGQFAGDLLTAWQDIDTYYSATNYSANILTVWIGTNNVSAAEAPEDTYASIVTYCQARQAAGWKVVMLTLLPRADASLNARVTSINASINTNWATFADAVVDVAADSLLDDPTDVAYYNADGIHLIGAGYGVVAGLVSTAIQGLM